MSRRAKAKRAANAAQADQLHERIEAERRKLQRAAAVLTALVYSSDSGLEAEQAADIASVAFDLIQGALDGLDIVALERPGER